MAPDVNGVSNTAPIWAPMIDTNVSTFMSTESMSPTERTSLWPCSVMHVARPGVTGGCCAMCVLF